MTRILVYYYILKIWILWFSYIISKNIVLFIASNSIIFLHNVTYINYCKSNMSLEYKLMVFLIDKKYSFNTYLNILTDLKNVYK